MAGSKRTFSYSLTSKPEETEALAAKARKVLSYACDGDDRIECHEVTGEALGTVILNLTVIGRDQWACRQLVQDILNIVTWGLEQDTDLELMSRRQQPHDHRGYAHGRTKRYREPKQT